MDLNSSVRRLLESMGADLVGFADVAGLAPDGFTRAVVAAIALPVEIIEEIPVGPTPAYMDTYKELNRRLDEMSAAVEAHLTALGHRSMALTRERAPWNRESMSTPFPYKTSATRAGLGWVGKCALLVTPEYGPALRLTVTLTDAPLEPGTPIGESRCGGCRKCVEACPGQAITDTLWTAGMPREQLVSIPDCDRAASDLAEKTLGYRTIMCGRCFAACPYTQSYVRRAREGLNANNAIVKE